MDLAQPMHLESELWSFWYSLSVTGFHFWPETYEENVQGSD